MRINQAVLVLLLAAPCLGQDDLKPEAGPAPAASKSAVKHTPITFRLTTYHFTKLAGIAKGSPDSEDISDDKGKYRLTIPSGAKKGEEGSAWRLRMEGTGVWEDGGKTYFVFWDSDDKNFKFIKKNRVSKYKPFRTVAGDIGNKPQKDKKLGFKYGKKFYIAELDGVDLPDGTKHDGWVTLNDAGDGIYGLHLDLFCLNEEWESKIAEKLKAKGAKDAADGYLVSVTFDGADKLPPSYDYGLTGAKNNDYGTARPPEWK